MTIQNNSIKKDAFRTIKIICPNCKNSKSINLPLQMIHQSDGIVTVSIPSGLVCDHPFQVFVDKNGSVRGYQSIDIDFGKIEYFEANHDKSRIITYALSNLFKEIIHLIRLKSKEKKILGGAIFTHDGYIIYSSLSDNVFYSISKELEFRNSNDLLNFRRQAILLNKFEKVYVNLLELQNSQLAIVFQISADIDSRMADFIQNNLVNNIIAINFKVDGKVVHTGNYWIYSTVKKQDLTSESEEIEINGIKVAKNVIQNFDFIEAVGKHHEYTGKIYFTDRYVQLMRGLANTMANAYKFMSKLNKKPDGY